MGRPVQLSAYEGEIVVVEGVKGNSELESCCSDCSLNCREIGVGASGLPSRHHGLMTAQPIGELSLGETCPFAGLANE